MTLVRLNKYLKDMGLCSRRKADEFIAKGYVKINGEIITELGYKVNTELDKVEILPELKQETDSFVYILLNKPKNYVCSHSRNDGKPVFDLLPDIKDLTYAGRLDKDSHGLLLLSNDGKFVYQAFGAEFIKEKEYLVRVDKPVTPEFIQSQISGSIVLDGKQLRPAKLKQVNDNVYRIILTEGINRQIRRMAEVMGYKVLDLKRIRIGNIDDRSLLPGKWRYLTDKEISQVMNKTGK